MKETRFFFDPELSGQLPEDEAKHAVRVLRLAEGDVINLMDGRGTFCEAVITAAGNHRCLYRITLREEQQPAWTGHLHLAMAPTKLNDRIEWFAEKATEIGFDELSFLRCRFSERRELKTERVDKIVVSATKQSHKAWKPVVNEMEDFKKFVQAERPGQKFICHCYEGEKKLLKEAIVPGEDALILVGPEGDFSEEEVAKAIEAGFQPVSLGKSRLRTETAALVAAHTLNLFNQK